MGRIGGLGMRRMMRLDPTMHYVLYGPPGRKMMAFLTVFRRRTWLLPIDV
jgi:hypothetical protein